MTVVAWIKLLLLSLSMVGVVRLLVVAICGRRHSPVRRSVASSDDFKVSSGIDASKQEDSSKSPKSAH